VEVQIVWLKVGVYRSKTPCGTNKNMNRAPDLLMKVFPKAFAWEDQPWQEGLGTRQMYWHQGYADTEYLGLVNGTTCTVEDVVWKEHADIKKDQPQALLIAVDGYNGPALYTQQD
jgi:hypothetical protein